MNQLHKQFSHLCSIVRAVLVLKCTQSLFSLQIHHKTGQLKAWGLQLFRTSKSVTYVGWRGDFSPFKPLNTSFSFFLMMASYKCNEHYVVGIPCFPCGDKANQPSHAYGMCIDWYHYHSKWHGSFVAGSDFTGAFLCAKENPPPMTSMTFRNVGLHNVNHVTWNLSRQVLQPRPFPNGVAHFEDTSQLVEALLFWHSFKFLGMSWHLCRCLCFSRV